jgi:hypothetical protein
MPADDLPCAVRTAHDIEEAVRILNHATLPALAWMGLDGPGDVYSVAGSLTAAARGLGQTCDQLAAFLDHHHRGGRLRGADGGDAGERVTEVTGALVAAAAAAEELTAALERGRRGLCWLGEAE